MTNAEIADAFETLAALMDLHEENAFKSKAYASAAFNLSRLPQTLAVLPPQELAALPFGESVKKGIAELLSTGTLSALGPLLQKTPPGLITMMKIKGLGPKKVRAVWHGLGVESIGELEYACTENRLASLKGFGKKTQDTIAQSIEFFKASTGYQLWAKAMLTAGEHLSRLKADLPGARFSVTGALRRQLEVIALTELVTDAAPTQVAAHFSALGYDVQHTEGQLDALSSTAPPVRVYCTTAEAFGTTLLSTTGSGDFVASLGTLPAGIFREEKEVFASLGVPYVPPPLREAVLQAGYPEDLIQPGDIRGLIHCHSTWSDGAATLEEMALAAREKGLEYMVISDHSAAAAYAGGLTPDRVFAQHAEIDALNAKLAPFHIFKSIEADILGDGALDYGSEVLAAFDIVIASVHSNLRMTEEKAMHRVMAAVRNPYTSILGHCTGRLLLAREGYPIDHRAVIDACAAHDVVLEINANPRRLDVDWRWIPYAMEKGVLLSVNPDAHSIRGIDDTVYGVMVAQKGGLSAAGNLSSCSLQEMEAFVGRQQAKRQAAGL